VTTAPPVPARSAIIHPETYRHGVPHAQLAALRAEAPAVWVDEPAVDHMPAGTGFWAVLGHAEVAHVLRTPAEFSSSLGLTQVYDAPPPLLPKLRTMMINMDPPEHSRLRGLLTKAFTPRAVALLEDRIRARAHELVAAVTGPPGTVGTCDFAADIAADLPLFTLADVLGVPESDRWLMFDWSNRVIGMLDDEYAASNAFGAGAATASRMGRAALAARPQPDENGRMPDSRHPSGMADLYAYARELAEFRRREPGEDVMSQLLRQVDAEGGRVSADEFEKLFWLFCVAGNETVRNALPGAMQALLEHPGELARLRGRPELVDGAVEEMLRWWTPVIQFRRTAARDVVLGGVPIPAGDKVVVFFSAANRDESVFADPDRFDVTRRPNPHLAFGHGPHFCVAAQLARVQLRSMLSAVLARWSDVEPAGHPERLRSNFQNGIKHQPVRFTAGAARSAAS
jgi:cytochrome P450